MYWADSGIGMINSANTDGSSLESIITTDNPTFNRPQSVYLDERGGKVYYAISFSGEQIARANLDGSDVEILVEDGIESPEDIFVINREPSSTNSVSSEFAKVYPNPFTDNLTFLTDRIIDSIELYDSNGKMIFVSSSKSNAYNLSHLIEGVYFCLIRSGKEEQYIKLVKL